MTTRPFALAVISLLATTGGCQQQVEPPIRSAEDVTRFVDLPGLAHTHDPELRKEYERLVSERATPRLMSKSDLRTGKAIVEISARFDGRPALQQIFNENDRKSLASRVESTYPAGNFQFTSHRFESVTELNREQSEQRVRYQELILRNDLVFPINYAEGLAFDTEFVDLVTLGNRLLGLAAAENIEHGQLPDAVNRVEEMLRGAQILAHTNHVVPRMTAAKSREEALLVVEAICLHPAVDASLYQRMLSILDAQLSEWPEDADTWRGDRAIGLHTYELVRAGYLLSLLDYEERNQYREEVGLRNMALAVMKNIEFDQSLYLSTMRKAILECKKPYFQRKRFFDRLQKTMDGNRETAQYAYVADQILLADLQDGHRSQALDLARTMGWQVALAAVLGEPRSKKKNPLTGHFFLVERHPDHVLVDGIDLVNQSPPIVIPRPSSTQ